FIGVNGIDENVYIYRLNPDVENRGSAPTPAPPSAVSAPPILLASQAPASPSSTSQVSIPLKQWVALAAPPPNSGKGIPSVSKHVNAAYHPPSGRIYFTGGDYSGGAGMVTGSYRQETWSLSIPERLAARNDPAAGWRLEYAYCGPAGQIQPKHPDYMGWV